MTQPRKRKQPAVPAPTAPTTPVQQPAIITADEFRDALTWTYPITPTRSMRCRHMGQEDLLFSGVVPAPLMVAMAQRGVIPATLDHLAIDPALVPVLERYACTVALEPRVLPRADEGELDPVEGPGEIGVWRLPLSILAGLFAEGVHRVLEVRPISPMFPGTNGAASDGTALRGEGVRATSEPLATPGADA